jgi:hypothetical protein
VQRALDQISIEVPVTQRGSFMWAPVVEGIEVVLTCTNEANGEPRAFNSKDPADEEVRDRYEFLLTHEV